MQLSVITSSEHKSVSVDFVELNTAVGNIVIQNGHAPTVLVLAPNSHILYGSLQTTESQIMSVKQAVAHITRTDVTILITEQ